MERLYYSGKMYLTNLQIYYCCWLVPVRIALFIIGYLNIAVDLLFLMGISSDDLEPTVLRVQNELLQNVSKPIPVAAYATELGFNVVLLCGLHNKDIILVSIFLYYTIFAVALSFATYSLVLAAVKLHYKLAIIFSTLFQIYCILLVRSELINMKMRHKMYKYSLLKMSSNPSTLSYSNPNYVPQDGTEVVIIGNDSVKYSKETESKNYPKQNSDLTDKDVDYKIVDDNEIKSKNEIDKKSQAAEKREARLAKKAEEKRIKEENKRIKGQKAEKIMRDEMKAEDKRIKEVTKAEEKRIREEKKAEMKRIKEENKSKGKRNKHEQKVEDNTDQNIEEVTKDAHEKRNHESDSEK